MNWRFYRDLSGGAISDLGAHQIDIFNWFLGAVPKSLYATGAGNYFKNREHFDNVMALFDYETPRGLVRAFYQVLTTTSAGGGYYESFMGTGNHQDIGEFECDRNLQGNQSGTKDPTVPVDPTAKIPRRSRGTDWSIADSCASRPQLRNRRPRGSLIPVSPLRPKGSRCPANSPAHGRISRISSPPSVVRRNSTATPATPSSAKRRFIMSIRPLYPNNRSFSLPNN